MTVMEGDNEGKTALHVASLEGHSEAVKLLLEAGAEVDAEDDNGQTPLSWAAENGHSEAVKLLQEREKEREWIVG